MNNTYYLDFKQQVCKNEGGERIVTIHHWNKKGVDRANQWFNMPGLKLTQLIKGG